MNHPPLKLRPREERRLRAGHLWVYSNEVDVKATPLTALEPGTTVAIQDSRGKTLGMGYVNPHSLICARLVSRNPHRDLDVGLIQDRLRVALALRERFFAKPYYRLVYGESDGLPGLVVDRYGEVLVAQISTLGMERHKAEILEAIAAVVKPTAVLWRNDTPARQLEGLDPYVEDALGEVPEQVELEENGVRFRAALRAGQKTGWYYDHRDNRARLAAWSAGRRVLDVFSYAGAWGVQAAAGGAAEVVCVDSSAGALEQVTEHAELNGVADRVRGVEGNAFDVLRSLQGESAKFDVVVLDPPAFIKRRKDTEEGENAYRRINQLAMQVLAQDGLLVSASCSHHLSAGRLSQLAHTGGRQLGRTVQIVAQGHQAADHPVHPAMPETEYLKAFFLRVVSP